MREGAKLSSSKLMDAEQKGPTGTETVQFGKSFQAEMEKPCKLAEGSSVVDL